MAFQYHKSLTMQVGACPARAYYSVGRPVYLKKWRFAYFDDEPTEEEALAVSPGREIAVPSCWQMLGFGQHQYTNLKYPFPYDPPFIDRNDPCGVYVTQFARSAASGRYYLNFDGVDSCFYVYVNGKFVGYSSVPHCHSEFDITAFLEDENELRVVVFQFCAGSYLEDQDKLRMSGIFRDVYILHRPEGHVFDYTLSSFYDVSGGEGTLKVRADALCKFTFYSDDGTRIGSKTDLEMCLTLPVRPWSAEEPVLYTLVIERAGERIVEKVGFRTVKAEGNVLTLNGVPVKFKGVNRHSMTTKGYTESLSDLKRDLDLIKGMNANAIRTSHYPPHPMLPRLCDERGIYLLEEADVESHGTCAQRNFYRGGQYLNDLAEDKRFRDQIVGRAVRMYERDKNRPSVLIWSLGNESGWGENFIASAKALKEKGDGRLLHYEGAWSNPKQRYYDDGGLLDLYSRMYPEQEWLDEFAKTADRPVVLCEYTHAMGNSCGDISDYWKIIDAHPSLCGGFIWEWCDHSVIKGKKTLYGGDFGEYPHDGNFCMDGIVTTDRKKEPEYDHVRAVYGGEREQQPPAMPAFPSAKGFSWKTEKGAISRLTVGEREFLRRPAFLSLWRALTDNDVHIGEEWRGYGLDRAYFFPRRYGDDRATGKIVAPYLQPVGDMEIGYREEGGLVVTAKVKLSPFVKSLPRFGFVLDLAETDCEVFWYGRGEGQAYCDKTAGCPVGYYRRPAKEMNYAYPKPQESGSRCDTRFVGLDFGGSALLFESETPFSFCVSPYLPSDYKAHSYEMKDTGRLYLYVDYKMAGVGSNSCGPRIKDRYLLTEREFTFKFRIRAVERG